MESFQEQDTTAAAAFENNRERLKQFAVDYASNVKIFLDITGQRRRRQCRDIEIFFNSGNEKRKTIKQFLLEYALRTLMTGMSPTEVHEAHITREKGMLVIEYRNLVDEAANENLKLVMYPFTSIHHIEVLRSRESDSRKYFVAGEKEEEEEKNDR